MNVAWAEQHNLAEGTKKSWVASSEEIAGTKRESRSSKPEVVFKLASPQRLESKFAAAESPVVVHQPTSTPTPTPPQLQPTAPSIVLYGTPPQPAVSPIPPLPQQPPQPPAVQVVQLPVANQSNDSEGDDEVFSDDSAEMSEDRSVVPTTFAGRAGDDPENWLRHFDNYCRYKQYNDDKSLALLRVLLTGNAGIWLDSLPTATANSLALLKQNFNDRYRTPDIIRFKSAQLIFSRKQGTDESCDDYIADLRRLGRNIEADDKMVRFAIMSGLRPNISAYVAQQQPTTVDKVLELARIAELTCSDRPPGDTVMSQQLADVQTEVKKLAMKWDRLTTAPIGETIQQTLRSRQIPRSPSPQRRVTFVEPTRDGQSFTRPMGRDGPQGPGRVNDWGFTQRPRYDGPGRYQTGLQNSTCQRCGRRMHPLINCPAANKRCNFCNRMGHFSICCRGAARGKGMSPVGENRQQ